MVALVFFIYFFVTYAEFCTFAQKYFNMSLNNVPYPQDIIDPSELPDAYDEILDHIDNLQVTGPTWSSMRQDMLQTGLPVLAPYFAGIGSIARDQADRGYNVNTVQDRMYLANPAENNSADVAANIRGQQKNFQNMYNNDAIHMDNSGNDTQWGVKRATRGQRVGMFASDIAAGAAAGSKFGWPGAIVGGALGLIQAGATLAEGDKRVNNANFIINQANYDQEKNKYSTIRRNSILNHRAAERNAMNTFHNTQYELGGKLRDIDNKVNIFKGPSHTDNPLDGIPQGIAPDGLPNLVEGDEVKWNDYIFSAKLKARGGYLKDNLLPERYEGKTFAYIAQQLQKESEDRPLNHVSNNTKDTMLGRLMTAQESYKQKLEEQRIMRLMKKLTPAEQDIVLNTMLQQMQPAPAESLPTDIATPEPMPPQQEQPLFKAGGHLFTGGGRSDTPSRDELLQQAIDAFTGGTPNANRGFELIKKLYNTAAFTNKRTKGRSLGFNNDGFQYYTKGKGYDSDYLNWLNSFEANEDNAAYVALLKDLYNTYTAQKTPWTDQTRNQIIRELGQDKKFGDFHNLLALMYDMSRMTPANQGVGQAAVDPASVVEPQIKTRWWYAPTNGDPYLMSDEDYQSGAWRSAWEYDPLLDQQGPENDDTTLYNDYYVVPKQQAVVEESVTPATRPIQPRPNLARYAAPVGSGAMAAYSLLQPVDYRFGTALRQNAALYQPVAAPQLYNYLGYNPDDVNIANSSAIASNAAMQRELGNNPNLGTSTAARLANQFAFNSQLARNELAAENQNWVKNRDVVSHNKDTDVRNLASSIQAMNTNANIRAQRARQLNLAAEADDNARTAQAASASANITNFLNNLNALGREHTYADMMLMDPRFEKMGPQAGQAYYNIVDPFGYYRYFNS